MIHRINIFILSLIIAIAPSFAYATAAPALQFSNLANVVRNAGGIVADFVFKRGTATAVATARSVSVAELAPIARKRILCGNLYGLIACSVGTLVLEQLLTGDGWIIDRENGRIHKEDSTENPEYIWMYNDQTGAVKYSKNEDEACGVVKAMASTYGWPKDGTSTRQYANNNNEFKCTYTVPGNYTYIWFSRVLNPNYEKTDRDITDAEIADKLKDVPTDDLIALAGSPDYAAENHPVVAAAAAAAQDKPEECTSGQKLNPATGKCEADSTTNPDTPKNPDLPAFCSWVPVAICNWYTDTQPRITNIETATKDTKTNTTDILTEEKKQTAEAVKTNAALDELTKNENNNNEQDNNLDFPSIPMPTNTQVVFDHSCPAPVTLAGFTYHGISQNWVVDFSSMCDVLTSIVRPVVIAVGSFISIGIIAGIRENG